MRASISIELFGANTMMTMFGQSTGEIENNKIMLSPNGLYCLQSFPKRIFVLWGKNQIREEITIARNNVIMAKIHFDEKGHTVINNFISFDGRILKQSPNVASLDNLKKSSFFHVDLDERDQIIEFRLSMKFSRFVSMFLDMNCLFAIRFDGTGFRKTLHILKASFKSVGTIDPEPINVIPPSIADQAALKLKTFGNILRTGSYERIGRNENFAIRDISNREFGMFGNLNNCTISVSRLRNILAVIQFKNGIATINTDHKFDGQTVNATIPTFPRPVLQRSEFMNIQLDTVGNHDIAEIGVGMNGHKYLYLFFSYTSMLVVSFNADNTRRGIESEIH